MNMKNLKIITKSKDRLKGKNNKKLQRDSLLIKSSVKKDLKKLMIPI